MGQSSRVSHWNALCLNHQSASGQKLAVVFLGHFEKREGHFEGVWAPHGREGHFEGEWAPWEGGHFEREWAPWEGGGL